MSTNILDTRIIIFRDDTYFCGVKGHQVRKSKHFKDAKIMSEINDRDRRYLEKHEYQLCNATYTMKITKVVEQNNIK